VIVGVVVLLIAGGTTAFLLAGNDNAKPTGAGATTAAATATGGATSTPTAAAPTTGAPAPPPAASVTLATPDRIGTLRKSSDQSKANTLKSGIASANLDQAIGVAYEDPAAKSHQMFVYGGVSPSIGLLPPETQLDGFFTAAEAQLGGGHLGARTDVSTGAVGGKAQCAKVDGTAATLSMCAWVGDDALLGFLFLGFTADKAKAQVPPALTAIVKKG
jgi:hypothetical protein